MQEAFDGQGRPQFFNPAISAQGSLNRKGECMPIKLNCGLSRKVADQNYGSRGASINVEVEVESSLAGNPTALKDRIKRIFGLVRDSLSEELNSAGNSQVRPTGQNAQQPGSAA